MGNKPAVNATAQEDGTWQRKAFNGKGVAIVKSTEQAGAFTCMQTQTACNQTKSASLLVRIDQAERTVLVNLSDKVLI